MITQAQDLAQSIERAWTDRVVADKGRPSWKSPWVYASGFSPCVRQLYLNMVEGDKRPTFSADTLANFQRGEDRGNTLVHRLGLIGQFHDPPFRVVGQEERFELKDRRGRVVIVGKTDATLDFGNGFRPKMEVKSWDRTLTERIHRFDDVFDNIWTRKGGYQLLAYLYGSGQPIGFMMLDRPGVPRLISVELENNLDRMEDFLTKATEAQDYREMQTAPDYITDSAECRKCAFFGSVCNPPTFSGDGAQITVDPEEIQKLERAIELESAWIEYERIWKWVKERFRGVEYSLAGNVLIKGKWGGKIEYDFPPEIETQIESWKQTYRKSLSKGKFTIEIEKI